MKKEAMTLRELAFVRDVLLPRAWVQGAEVYELVRLREKLARVFAQVTLPKLDPSEDGSES